MFDFSILEKVALSLSEKNRQWSWKTSDKYALHTIPFMFPFMRSAISSI
jgi:hypothetical protein